MSGDREVLEVRRMIKLTGEQCRVLSEPLSTAVVDVRISGIDTRWATRYASSEQHGGGSCNES